MQYMTFRVITRSQQKTNKRIYKKRNEKENDKKHCECLISKNPDRKLGVC